MNSSKSQNENLKNILFGILFKLSKFFIGLKEIKRLHPVFIFQVYIIIKNGKLQVRDMPDNK